MAFADPQSVTVAGTAVSLPRTGSGVNSGAFTAPDGTLALTVSSSYGKRTRRQIRLNGSKIVTDPLASDRNIPVSASVYLVVDTPTTGYSLDDQKALAAALVSYLGASSNARLTQLLGGEN